MKLNRNSWHYKLWAGTFEDRSYVPRDTDLCRYCHKVFWAVVLRAFMFGALAVAVVMGAYLLFYKGLYLHPLTFLEVTAIIASVIGAIVLYVRWINGRRSYQEPKTLVGKYARAAKQGVCPLVEFTDSEEE